MIQKNIAILAVLIHLFFVGKAQDPGQNLNKWSLLNPIEKAHLHLDRQSYFSGQTIWFKGYLVSEYAPSIKSTTLYVEFLNNQGGIISRKVLPVYQGSTQGQFDLPDTLQSGSYQLRAYTPLMLNQPGFWYSSRITVFGKTSIQNQNHLPQQTTLLQFFPEGGNLIKGLVNNVAFKATDPYGLPVKVTGRIMNAKNELICPLNSIHDGMGTFTLIPLADEAYFVELDGVPGTKYDLPVATTKGIALNVRQSRRGVECTITQLRGDDNFRAAYMIGQMQNNVVFRVDFNNAKDQFSTIFKTDELLSGILQITLFNKYGMPLAERLSFVNNKEYMMAGELIADTLNISERKRNHFSLQIPDTVIGSFSVSVTDADFEESPHRQQNMYSSLLLTNDIRGYVHNPAYYFTGPADSAKRALDLVMMTNGWTRFKWVDAAANTLPLPLYKSPGYISLAGKINIEGTRKAFANKDLMVMFKPVD